MALRREIHEGLNVIEQWNGANDFVFFARRGEMTSNRREDQEISMLSLHLLQNCMVYVNTLMLQEVLAQPHWQGSLTARISGADAADLGARQSLRPLRTGHDDPTAAQMIHMAAGDTTVGSRPGRRGMGGSQARSVPDTRGIEPGK